MLTPEFIGFVFRLVLRLLCGPGISIVFLEADIMFPSKGINYHLIQEI